MNRPCSPQKIHIRKKNREKALISSLLWFSLLDLADVGVVMTTAYSKSVSLLTLSETLLLRRTQPSAPLTSCFIWDLLQPALGFPCSLVGKESACSAGNLGLIPGLGRSPGEGNGNPLQYPCLENLMDRGAWRAAVHGVTKSWARLSD